MNKIATIRPVVCLWCAIGGKGTREKESMKYGILVFSES
jgi:hypothetical protein